MESVSRPEGKNEKGTGNPVPMVMEYNRRDSLIRGGPKGRLYKRTRPLPSLEGEAGELAVAVIKEYGALWRA